MIRTLTEQEFTDNFITPVSSKILISFFLQLSINYEEKKKPFRHFLFIVDFNGACEFEHPKFRRSAE